VPSRGTGKATCFSAKAISAVATLVERKSRFVILVGLPNGHQADVVTDALAARIVTLPQQLRRSITWDHGKEMAQDDGDPSAAELNEPGLFGGFGR
jgi:IS30 family transposase